MADEWVGPCTVPLTRFLLINTQGASNSCYCFCLLFYHYHYYHYYCKLSCLQSRGETVNRSQELSKKKKLAGVVGSGVVGIQGIRQPLLALSTELNWPETTAADRERARARDRQRSSSGIVAVEKKMYDNKKKDDESEFVAGEADYGRRGGGRGCFGVLGLD